MESSKMSKIDFIMRKLFILEKRINKISNEIYLNRVEIMKTIKEEKDKEKEEYINDCGKIEP